jgi:hypothetical protein
MGGEECAMGLLRCVHGAAVFAIAAAAGGEFGGGGRSGEQGQEQPKAEQEQEQGCLNAPQIRSVHGSCDCGVTDVTSEWIELMSDDPGREWKFALSGLDLRRPIDERFELPLFGDEAEPAHALFGGEDGDYVWQVARAEATGDGDLNVTDELAGFEFRLEPIDGDGGMAFFGAAAAAAIADEDLSVDDSFGFEWVQHGARPLGI